VLDLIALDFDFVNEFFIHVKKTLKYKTFYWSAYQRGTKIFPSMDL
jgi:hypothetical protein